MIHAALLPKIADRHLCPDGLPAYQKTSIRSARDAPNPLTRQTSGYNHVKSTVTTGPGVVCPEGTVYKPNILLRLPGRSVR